MPTPKRGRPAAQPAVTADVRGSSRLGRRAFQTKNAFPVVERDLVAGRKVRLEAAAQPRGHRRLAERHVDFVVVLERSVVEVRRSDDRPRSIDEQRFHMCHRRTEFVYAHSAFEQLAVQAAAGQPNEALVGDTPGTTTRTSTPRRAARASERRRARSGRKYGVLMAMSDTAPSMSIWNTTRETVARSDGELLTSMASVRPAGSRRRGHSRGEVRISPQHSSQFSAKTP